MKNTHVLHFISSFEGTSYKNFKIQRPFLLFRVTLHQFLHQQIYFTIFLELHSALFEKIILSLIFLC